MNAPMPPPTIPIFSFFMFFSFKLLKLHIYTFAHFHTCTFAHFHTYTLAHSHFPNAPSNAIADGVKSSLRTNASASFAPCRRSMRESSHSTESGPR